MEDKQCFVEGCTADVEYTCSCSFPAVYTCKLHSSIHLDQDCKTHSLTSIFKETCTATREVVLKFFAKIGSKHKKIKKKVLASFNERSIEAKNELEELIFKIDTYRDQLNDYFTKVDQANRILNSEQDPVLELLSLQPDEAIKKLKTILPPKPDWNSDTKMFCRFSEKIEKMIELFIQDKFEGYIDGRLHPIKKDLKKYKKSIDLANNELANVKDFILNPVNENKSNLTKFEDWKQKTNEKTEDEVALLNAQINSIAEDLNENKSRLKKFEDWNQKNEQKTEDKIGLLSAQISSISEDLSRLKQAGKYQSQNAILAPQNLIDRRVQADNRLNNADLEQESKMAHTVYRNDPKVQNLPLAQAYQDNAMTYNQKICLYNIMSNYKKITTLFTYNIEAGTKQEKIIQTPEPIGCSTCITQLPNGKLFCYGSCSPFSGITLIIDESGEIQVLPSGTPCHWSSAIYFSSCVYCFGGSYNGNDLSLSSRFDLDRNEWVELAPLPKPDYCCNSIIFNGNILISGYKNRNLVRYSIVNFSFATIPYQFAEERRKILINGERLYLVECDEGSIYESEIGSDTAWRQIAKSAFVFPPDQIYCSYIKGKAYIGCIRLYIKNHPDEIKYFKFSLSKKCLINLP